MQAIRRVEGAGDVGGPHQRVGHRVLPARLLHPGASHRRRYVNGPVPRVMPWATAAGSLAKSGLHMTRRTLGVGVAVRPRSNQGSLTGRAVCLLEDFRR
jgi:hypothetical protein